MKLIARILLIIIVSHLMSLYLPWWIIIVVSFIVGFTIHGGSFPVFISGFLGGGLLWLGYSWYLNYKTDAILANKIVELFPVNDTLYMIIFSGLIGAIASGFGASTGNSLRLIFIKKKSRSYYS